MERIEELKRICRAIERESPEYKRDPVNWYPMFLRNFSIYFTWLFLRLGVQATFVTVLWGIFGFLACIILAIGNFQNTIIGALLLQFAFLLDRVDGEVARYRKSFSQRGVFLDLLIEQVLLPLIFISVAINVFINTGSYFYLACGSSAAFFISVNFNSKFGELYVQQQFQIAVAGKQYNFENYSEKKVLGDVQKCEQEKNEKSKVRSLVFSLIRALFSDSAIFLLVLFFAIFNRLHVYLEVYGMLLPLQFVRKIHLRLTELS